MAVLGFDPEFLLTSCPLPRPGVGRQIRELP
jgi:hypothetical protein